MRKTIPEQKQTFCDCCSQQWVRFVRAKMQARLFLKAHALDYLGDASADGSREFDLCDDCMIEVSKAIEAVFKRLGPESDDTPTP